MGAGEILGPEAFEIQHHQGQGITEGRGRPDSFGLTIMRERATRIGASLTVKRRSPQGTVVELSLQAAGRSGEEGS